MLALLKFFDPIEWVLIAAIAALTVFLGIEWSRASIVRIELAHAQTELANLKTQYAQATAKAEAEARTEEARRTEATRKVVQDAQSQTAEAQSAAADASRAADGLRLRLAQYLASRSRSGDPSSPGRSAGVQGQDPLDLLASVLTRMGDDGGQVSAYADRLRIAGAACESSYDSLSK